MNDQKQHSIWADARKLAARETLDILRLNSFASALLTVGVPIATVLIYWLVTESLAHAPLIAILVYLTIGIIIFVLKFLRAPAVLGQEARDSLAQMAVNSEQEESRRKHSIVERLTNLYLLEGGGVLSPSVQAGLHLPPEDWLNERLANLGESWQVFNIRGTD